MADNENLNTEVVEPVEVVQDLPEGRSLLGATLGATAAEEEQEPDEEYETIPVQELLEVKLGRQGENDTQTVVIDCSAWLEKLPGCTLMIAATRPGEREIYLPEVTVSNGVVTWPILEQDTACAGTGRAEVRAMLNDKIKKSALFRTRVEPALEGDGSPDAPTPPNWVRLIIESVEASQQAAEHAEELIEEATACAINAVRFDEDQELTEPQKATGRGNIDAVSVAALQAQAAATTEALAGKVDIDQGVAQAGKVMVVGLDGNVTTGDAVQIDDTLQEAGQAADAAAVGAAFEDMAWVEDLKELVKEDGEPQETDVLIDLSSASFSSGYYNASGELKSSADWKYYNQLIEIQPNHWYKYHGRLLGQTACCLILDASQNVVGTVTGDEAHTAADAVPERFFETPDDAKYFRYIFFASPEMPTVTVKAVYNAEYVGGGTVVDDITEKVDALYDMLFDKKGGGGEPRETTIFIDLNSASFGNGYYDASGVQHSSESWKYYNQLIEIQPNHWYKYHGRLLGQTACCLILDASQNVVGTVTGNAGTSADDIILERFFETPANAKYLRYIWYNIWDAAAPDRSVYNAVVEDESDEYDFDGIHTVNYLSRAVDSEGGGNYDVCIVGGGAGGMGAAYALRKSGLKVCLIDKNSALGGTHAQAWVNVHAATPAPPYLFGVMEPLLASGKARYVNTYYQDIAQDGIVWSDTFLRQEFRQDGKSDICVFFEPKAMAEKYVEDLKPYITNRLGQTVTAASVSGGVVSNITLSGGEKIYAKVFIDCTGNDELLRFAGGTTYFGEDANTDFQSEYGITEAHAPSSPNRSLVNELELIYRIVTGSESIVLPSATSAQSVQPYTAVTQDKIYINSCNGFGGKTGNSVRNAGYDSTMNGMAALLPTYWALVKKNGVNSQGTWFPGYTAAALAEKKLYDHAPMLGIRETWRAKCERMLNENDLYVKISSSNLVQSSVLDSVIACGNHIADMHGTSSISWSAINANRKPYGVKYGSLVPKGFTNMLVASRGAGFTHIGASTFRLNKDIMQIGWAAGKACEIYVRDGLSDFRNVSAEKLLDDEYTGFVTTVKQLEEIMG